MSHWEAIENTPTGVLGLMRWVVWANQQNAENWVRDIGLSSEQSFTLGYLARFPGAIQRDIAEFTRTTPASVTSLLQGLERRELIERRTDEHNARIKRVYATQAGLDLIDGLQDAMNDGSAKVLEPLTAAEQKTLHGLLRKVTAQLPEPTR
jgi:MarR family transcriptional regulator, repressor for mepA